MLLNFLSEKLIDKEDHRVAERTFIHIMIQRLFHFVFIFFILFFNLQTDLLKKKVLSTLFALYRRQFV